MEQDQKKAATKGATIVFADESGFMMAPLVRKTWAPRGETPIIRQRGRSHTKVSAMGSVALSPKGRRVRVFFRLKPDGNFGGDECAEFIRQLEQNIKGPIILVWDRLRAHRSKTVAAQLKKSRRVEIELLPAYAPELNPVEYLWSYLKAVSMANFAPTELEELRSATKASICSMRRDRQLVRRIITGSPLMVSFFR